MISIDNLASEIVKELENYNENVTNEIKKAVDVVSKECKEEIKNHIEFKQHSGDYVKAFRLKTVSQDKYSKHITWYVGDGQYRLTHLLEKGHALHQGGRARAYHHIIYGEQLAKKRMEELSKEAITNAGH